MKYLKIEKEDSISIVSINRPKSMNALSIDVLKEFCELQEHFRQDLETRVVIFTGEGANFSAGADLKEKAQLSIEGIQLTQNSDSAKTQEEHIL